MTSSSFADLPLPPALLTNLKDMGYQSMTPIQAQALPQATAGRDLIAQAKTGSGKTATFGIPLLLQLNPRHFGVQGLVLCPTRELATQVAAEIRRLARYQENIKVVTLSGGQSIGPQIGSLEHGAHIVVGTPGRIKDHLRKQTLDLSGVKMLVLDEADRMLEMGFMEDMETIITHTPSSRQTLLFSATYPENIEALSSQFQRDPERINVESQLTAATITERFFLSSKDTKLEDLIQVLRHIQVPSAVIFCNMKQTTEEVARYLDSRRFNALALHGDLEQRERDQVLTQFKHQSCSILVATDVAARGLDVEDLPAVVNYDLPRDPDVYTHRIGRTARAGKHGLALSLLEEKERYKLDKIGASQEEKAPGDEKTVKLERPSELRVDPEFSMLPGRKTLVIAGGRKDKVRPGDVLGALTGEAGIPGKAVGKIDITDYSAFVTLARDHAKDALKRLANGKIKGRKYKVRLL
ncbi:ATP-dependent RNA helicase DbpA [Marinimicrobium locisalis]|uniref:ATP-dependent RNA helicase DbpA n=1 Tax=Marinimicrobium locisalis TaxID=546022 RepID=UPI0032220218